MFHIQDKLALMLFTFDALKQKAVDFVSDFSLSTIASPSSSLRAKYLPVVICRRRKGCPHLMLLPLQLNMRNQKTIYEAGKNSNSILGFEGCSEKEKKKKGELYIFIFAFDFNICIKTDAKLLTYLQREPWKEAYL